MGVINMNGQRYYHELDWSMEKEANAFIEDVISRLNMLFNRDIVGYFNIQQIEVPTIIVTDLSSEKGDIWGRYCPSTHTIFIDYMHNTEIEVLHHETIHALLYVNGCPAEDGTRLFETILNNYGYTSNITRAGYHGVLESFLHESVSDRSVFEYVTTQIIELLISGDCNPVDILNISRDFLSMTVSYPPLMEIEREMEKLISLIS